MVPLWKLNAYLDRWGQAGQDWCTFVAAVAVLPALSAAETVNVLRPSDLGADPHPRGHRSGERRRRSRWFVGARVSAATRLPSRTFAPSAGMLIRIAGASRSTTWMVAVFERVTAGDPVEADSVTVYVSSGVAGGTGTRTLTVFRLRG